jgi:hypothetical protein
MLKYIQGMTLKDALKRYDTIVDTYDSIPFDDKMATAELMKDMAVCLSYLTMHRIAYQKEWNKIVFEFKGTNAAGERKADEAKPELYKLRRIHEAGKIIQDTMRSQISLLKQENN